MTHGHCIQDQCLYRAPISASRSHSITRYFIKKLTEKTLMLRLLRQTIVGLALLCVGCSDTDQSAPPSSTETIDNTKPIEAANPALNELAQKQVGQALQAGLALQQSIVELLKMPDVNTLTQAQQAWRGAAAELESLHVFSLLGAPSNSTHPFLFRQQYNLAAWPIQPGYLDTYGDHPYSGLVFDIGLPLTAELLREQHGLTSEGDASLGIYAIEFILFGENDNRGPLLFQPITSLNEQHKIAGYEQVHELPRNRRRQLLQLQADLLVEDIQQLQQYWQTQKPQISNTDFQFASQALATQHIIDAAQLQKSKTPETPQQRLILGQQLAKRMMAQLAGWQQGLTLTDIPNQAELTLISQEVLENLRPISQAAIPEQPMPNELKAKRAQWKRVYQGLRRLAAELSGETTKPGNTDAAPAEE